MKLPLFLLLIILALPALGQQTKLNRPLQRELDSIRTIDQKYRFLLAATRHQRKADSLETALHLPKGQLFTYALTHMQRVDSSNLRRMEVILQRYGYPGKSLVGTPANETAWYVIQHSDKIPQYLPLVKTAAEKGELPYWMYAQMLDRQLMQEGKEQLYGTQAAGYRVRNKQTGQPEQVMFLWPVSDPAHADVRRRKVGLTGTLAESAKSLVGAYKPVTLEYAKQMQQEAEELAKQHEPKL
jgi:hypothetical protein